MEGLTPPVAEFDSAEADPPEQIARLRQTASEQALFYRDNQERILDAHADKYVFLQDGEVIWSGLKPEEAGAVQERRRGQKGSGGLAQASRSSRARGRADGGVREDSGGLKFYAQRASRSTSALMASRSRSLPSWG